jgi:hypothetical protein
MYQVEHISYCGMRGIPTCFDTEEEARQYAADFIRRYRRRYKLTTLQPGEKWEVLEPENTVLVPDACGVLSIEHVTYECFECGTHHDTKHDALHCCAEYNRGEE